MWPFISISVCFGIGTTIHISVSHMRDSFATIASVHVYCQCKTVRTFPIDYMTIESFAMITYVANILSIDIVAIVAILAYVVMLLLLRGLLVFLVNDASVSIITSVARGASVASVANYPSVAGTCNSNYSCK